MHVSAGVSGGQMLPSDVFLNYYLLFFFFLKKGYLFLNQELIDLTRPAGQ